MLFDLGFVVPAKKLIKWLFLFGLLNQIVQADVAVFKHHELEGGLFDGAIKSIAEDKNGFIWVGTQTSVFRFDGVSFKKLPTEAIADNVDVIDLFVDHDNNIWIGSKNNGLLRYSDQKIEKIVANNIDIKSVFEIKADTNKKIWVASDQGLFNLTEGSLGGKPTLEGPLVLGNNRLTALEFVHDELLVLGQVGGFYLSDIKTNEQMHFPIDNTGQDSIYDLFLDSQKKLWVATSKQLLKFDPETKRFSNPIYLKDASRILSIAQHNDYLWVATIDGGVYKVNAKTHATVQYINQKQFIHSITENHIRSVFVSKQGLLWVGGFSKGLSSLNLNLMNFAFESNVVGSYECAKNPQIYSLEVGKDKDVWLGLESGLVKFNEVNKTCQAIDLGPIDKDLKPHIYHTEINKDLMWISGRQGLLKHELSSGITYDLGAELQKVVFFAHQVFSEKLLVGTESGLYFYWISTGQFERIKVPSEKFRNRPFLKFAKNSKGEVYLPTSQGLLYLNEAGELLEFSPVGASFSGSHILAIEFKAGNEMFVSVESEGLYHFKDNSVVQHYFVDTLISGKNQVYQIQYDDPSGTLWLGSLDGLIFLNPENGESHLYKRQDNFNYFSQIRSSGQHGEDVYFAGNTGYLHFKPSEINIPKLERKVLIDSLSVINDGFKNEFKTHQETGLNQIIQPDDIKAFSHRDRLLVIEFMALDYVEPEDIVYAYKLEPVLPEWVNLPIGDRRLVFTNLKSGDYELAIKASINKHQWSDQITHINLKVNPPPWLTWWAYMCYLTLFFLASIFYSRSNVRKEREVNLYLNQQVDKQTAHIKKQKETVEQLMASRNEMFANVTHEFRTPLTLIQGPIFELKKNEQDQHNLNMLSMVSKNAKKLLRLVNQMLTVSEVTEKSIQIKEKVDVINNLKVIVEPYVYSARNKGIILRTDQFEEGYIEATPDCLDLIIGNLLSNSIKYTQPEGTISLGTVLHKENIEIYVDDTGMGFDQNDVEHIFKRFSRLPQNQEVEGAGIGLALVKELVGLNDGHISVQSEKGVGSRFSVFFPVLEMNQPGDVGSEIDLNQLSEDVGGQFELDSHKDTVLIIEDNSDMRIYIKSVLAENFKCVVAENGSEGIALALKLVPDVIICDVMMPGVDGFHVCRVLRNEMITSHIPLILLTALTRKSSRIKGWRENIDMYLNKPFDADELNLQIRNVLNVRAILKQNNHSRTKLKNKIKISTLDQKFIDKLRKIISTNYQELSFNLKVMAQEMCVSDRQLQRKTKALIGLSPMDLLREYRLKQAAKSLRDGYQISVTSDICGFSSISYFSQAFKKQFGMTPRDYQQLNQEK